MKKLNKHKQRGVGLLGLLFLATVGGFLLVTGMEVIPSFIEYQAIKRAATRAATGTSPAEVRDLFSKQAEVDNISTLHARDLQISKDSAGNVVISFSYEKRIGLVGPVSLVIDYSGSSKSR